MVRVEDICDSIVLTQNKELGIDTRYCGDPEGKCPFRSSEQPERAWSSDGRYKHICFKAKAHASHGYD